MFRRLWRQLKVWKRVGLGPISLVFRFDRSVRMTRGSFRSRHSHKVDNVSSSSGGTGGRSHDIAATPAGSSPRAAQCAVIVGVGPGFGYALARQLAAEGFDLILVSREAHRLHPLVLDLHSHGITVESYGTDATDEAAVAKLFDHVCASHDIPTLVVYAVQYFGRGDTTEMEVPAFESAWRHNCLGAFLVSRRAAQVMLARGSGTIVLVGSTSSLIGRAGYLNLAVGKFGQRALAQVMARELWPKGIHVAHAVVDADIADDRPDPSGAPQSDPNHIAASILALHRQPNTAWTSELDLRPWNEKFWEHC